ncbi:hypothetical protein DID88_005700 [Monilinia fructigena]|uniref:Uncharacterized protein n=1 Tax=Monilinia fructigena TaxID=38457 RepID=A0A395J5U0_9HELO|nr:hypothetical protein DID88_005700 [Monilinia fructigena]
MEMDVIYPPTPSATSSPQTSSPHPQRHPTLPHPNLPLVNNLLPLPPPQPPPPLPHLAPHHPTSHPPLWTACLSQTLTLLLPSTLLTLLTQTLSSNPTYNPPSRTGTTYLFLLHTIWLIHFVALATLLALQYTRKRRRRLIAELDDFNTGVRVPRAPVRIAPSVWVGRCTGGFSCCVSGVL